MKEDNLTLEEAKREVRAGWGDILTRLWPQLKGLPVTTVKEKYGMLRVYYLGSDTEVDRAIEDAETESSFTCETCGSKRGKLRDGRWWKTLCDNCTREV